MDKYTRNLKAYPHAVSKKVNRARNAIIVNIKHEFVKMLPEDMPIKKRAELVEYVSKAASKVEQMNIETFNI